MKETHELHDYITNVINPSCEWRRNNDVTLC